MAEILFTEADIRRHLTSVAELLSAQNHPQATVIIVGGSFLVLHGLRPEGTRDVDSIERITDAVREAVRQVADENDLRLDWLNDRAVAFAPEGFEREQCEIVSNHPALLVLQPSHDRVFLMKLRAGRSQDREDMIALWRHCSFTSAEEAAQRYQNAYPLLEHDPHLAHYIEEIAAAAQKRK